jgi:hypothetical protein
MKIVINRCYGGYSLSRRAYKELGRKWDGDGSAYMSCRTNQKLVAAVEKLGDAASGVLAKLEVVEIPDGVDWELENYDGIETVHEKHGVKIASKERKAVIEIPDDVDWILEDYDGAETGHEKHRVWC